MGRFNWYPWARFQGLGSGFFQLTGGIIALWYPNKMILAIANIAAGLLLLFWDYPFAPFGSLGFLSSNLYLRALVHAGAIVPAILVAPTSTAAMCLVFSVIMLLRAAINGESWEPPKKRPAKKDGGKDMSAIKAPEN
ncbi:hypothetical protein BC832DRAFT_548925 [Gaertneriomyces semiglobifer]|nr:hypothetical protein BC832DRAFT_548925 [Gaertneriomyces semiglobifer]